MRALQESEERYRSLVIATAQIVWSTNADGHVSAPMPLWTAYTGQQEPEILGWGWLEAVHPDDRVITTQRWQQAVATKTLYENEYRLRRADGSYREFAVRGVPVLRQDGSIREWVGICTDITEHKQVERAQRLLAEASSLLATSLDISTILNHLAHLIIPELADFCYLTLLNPDRQIQQVVRRHKDPARTVMLSQMPKGILTPTATPALWQNLLAGETVLVPQVQADWLETMVNCPQQRQHLQELALTSLIGVPLRVHDRALGILTFCLSAATQRRYTTDDLNLTWDLAQRTALAVDNAQLYRMTQAAEQNLRQALLILGEHQQQLRTLQRLTDLLNQRLTNLPELLQVMVTACCEAIPGATFGLIALQNSQTQALEIVTFSGTGVEPLRQIQRFAADAGLLGEIFQAGTARLIRSPAALLPNEFIPRPAALCVATIASAQVGKLGLLVVGNWRDPDSFTAEDLQLLIAFSEQAAIAFTNAKLIHVLEEREERLAIQNRILNKQNRRLERQRQQIQYQNFKLQEAAQLKSQFLATMSHELRTPMNAIIGFSQLLLRQSGLTPKQQDMVERILNNGRHLLALVNDILDLSSIESGQIELKLEMINLDQLLRVTVEELRSLASQKQLALHLDLDLSNPCITNDRIRLRQILVNLLSNAIKFTESGYVRVCAEELNGDTIDAIAISVQDTGIGIAESDLQHIFEEFRQVDQTLSKRFQGTGLGLAITDWLVRMMQGKITVESEVGKGSTFRVELPRHLQNSRHRSS